MVSRTKTTGTVLLILLGIGIAGAWQFLPETEPAESSAALPPELLVETRVLQPISSIRQERRLTGTVVAARRTKLAFERSARIERILVDDGDQVAAGDVVAELDQRQLLKQLAELEARRTQQAAILKELQSGAREETIEAARAQLAALTADVELQLATLQRVRNLFNRQAISEQSQDEARLKWKASVARRDAAQQQLDELVAGTRPEKIDAQSATVSAFDAQIQQLEIQLNDSALAAPFAGTVTQRMVDEGDFVGPRQPVVELVETDNLEARVGVPSRLIPTLKQQDYLVLSTDTQSVTGSLKAVVPQVNTATRTQTAVIQVTQTDGDRPADGQLIHLILEEQVAAAGAFEVPLTALSTAPRGLWSVYVLHAEAANVATVQSRTVEVIHSDDQSAVIRGSVSTGDRIVTSGTHRVAPGQKVRWQTSSLPDGEDQ